ncbi:hypothetical protein ILUMI_20692 [Ignelater luminosus]|uniref:Uncharacterized protein n=1 Tax=Ignelater luminosus TaxID=2038154 RepID=A0A8K0CFY6_IGNLU|nr:hypothetical protein ILUMI_20692 [Ignelater luminosus]
MTEISFLNMNGTQFAFAVTLFSGIFVAICIYFDSQRRKDPAFRKKLKMKRDRDRLLKKAYVSSINILHDIEEPQDQETIILREIELAESLMAQQNYDKAIVHFANAIAICVDPCNLLIALKQSLPPNVFDLLIHVLVSNYGKQFSRFQEDSRLKSIVQNQAIIRF